MIFDKLKQVGELKKLRDQAMSLKKALAQEEIVIEENGIKIVVSGEQKVKELTINGESNRALVEVVNKALKKSQEIAAKKLQSMGGLGSLGF